MTSETTLTYQVYVAPIIAMAGKDIPPGQSRSTWSPISATLPPARADLSLSSLAPGTLAPWEPGPGQSPTFGPGKPRGPLALGEPAAARM